VVDDSGWSKLGEGMIGGKKREAKFVGGEACGGSVGKGGKRTGEGKKGITLVSSTNEYRGEEGWRSKFLLFGALWGGSPPVRFAQKG